MSKPWIHALSSAKRFGGKPEDYVELHQVMDSSKGAIADNRHRALTHTTWFLAPGGPLEWKFGIVIRNSDGRDVSVRDLGEQHVLEDFGGRFIPTAQDYLQEMEHRDWMVRGSGQPPSGARLNRVVRRVSMAEIRD